METAKGKLSTSIFTFFPLLIGLLVTFKKCHGMLVIGSAGLIDVDGASGVTDPTVQDLAREFWEWRLNESPEYATMYGLHHLDNKMEEYTEAAFERRKIAAERFLRRAKVIPSHVLDHKDRTTLIVLEECLQTFIEGYEYRMFGAYNQISPMVTPVSEWQNLLTWMPFTHDLHYQNLLERYKAIHIQITNRIDLMRRAIAAGVTLHNSSLTGVLDKFNRVIIAPELSDFFTPFRKMALGVTTENRTYFRDEGLRVVRDHVIPAFRRMRDFLATEYLPKTRAHPGVSSVPHGIAYYRKALKWYLSSEIPPQTLHQIGLREVLRIRKQIDDVIARTGFRGTIKNFVAMLNRTGTPFYKSEAEMLIGYRRRVTRLQNKSNQILKKATKASLRLARAKNINGPTGTYFPPSLDETRPGIFEANVFEPRNRPKYTMMAIAAHNTVPGHHLQAAYALERNLPLFRRAVEYRHQGSAPFNWLFHTAYTEGWALYAEKLAEELGVYDEPYAVFGRHASELFKAARLVVDTGIHSMGWSRDRAIRYLKQTTTLPDQHAENEINRYIAWPGQATAYKIGEMKITELRDRANETLGPMFDIRDFHEEVLGLGPVPLNILERHVNGWLHYTGSGTPCRECTTSLVLASFLSFCVLLLS